MFHSGHGLFLLILLLAPLIQLRAQDNTDFQLFEEVERPPEASEAQPVRPPGATRGANAAPTFTLVGTSRIGDRRSVMLEHRSGDVVQFEVRQGANTTIPGYRNFAVVHYGPRNVSIRYPDSEPCAVNESRGVGCSPDANIAALSLANR